jgi:hypothetical protein
MKSEPIKEVFNELFSHLERLETQSEAILQFLKEKKRVTDKQLAPYLEQAGNASNVRWRAARIRIEHLLEDSEKEKETKLGKKPEIAPAETAKQETAKPEAAKAETANDAQAAPENKQAENKYKEQPDKKVQTETSAASADKKPAATENKQGAPQAQQTSSTDGKTDQPKESNHPTEMTESLAQSKGAEPPAELSAEKKSGDKEAA